jgi:diaminohydroxyphosphoribosylaminopyrimidine deaminase/5-amino-6-(5-phosphoribosylamino)uracil reductase
MIHPMKPTHEYYMKMAISYALRGTGTTLSNPLVGCILVKNNRIIGKGYHKVFGQDHAEVIALREAGSESRGATAYVTLEPCSHHGKTPPCAPRLVNAGVERVVIGSMDPNPLVSGKGMEILQKGGVDVITDVLAGECRWINRGFFTRMNSGRPWITVKAAIGYDGKMCLPHGESKWITTSRSRRIAHLMRAENDAIMVGKGTALSDDPQLTVRTSPGTSPLKIVLDKDLTIPTGCRIFDKGKTLVYTSEYPDTSESARALYPENVQLVSSKKDAEGLLLHEVMKDLGSRGINRLLVEGGPATISSLFREDLVDEVVLFISPRFMGMGKGITDGLRFQCMESTIRVRDVRIGQMGNDLILEGLTTCLQDW